MTKAVHTKSRPWRFHFIADRVFYTNVYIIEPPARRIAAKSAI